MDKTESTTSASAASAGALEAEGSEEEEAFTNRLASLIVLAARDPARCRALESGGSSAWRAVEGATPKPAARRRPGRTETMAGFLSRLERGTEKEREREKRFFNLKKKKMSSLWGCFFFLPLLLLSPKTRSLLFSSTKISGQTEENFSRVLPLLCLESLSIDENARSDARRQHAREVHARLGDGE